MDFLGQNMGSDKFELCRSIGLIVWLTKLGEGGYGPITDFTVKAQDVENYLAKCKNTDQIDVQKLKRELRLLKDIVKELLDKKAMVEIENIRLGKEVEELMKVDCWQDRYNIVVDELKKLKNKGG